MKHMKLHDFQEMSKRNAAMSPPNTSQPRRFIISGRTHQATHGTVHLRPRCRWGPGSRGHETRWRCPRNDLSARRIKLWKISRVETTKIAKPLGKTGEMRNLWENVVDSTWISSLIIGIYSR